MVLKMRLSMEQAHPSDPIFLRLVPVAQVAERAVMEMVEFDVRAAAVVRMDPRSGGGTWGSGFRRGQGTYSSKFWLFIYNRISLGPGGSGATLMHPGGGGGGGILINGNGPDIPAQSGNGYGYGAGGSGIGFGAGGGAGSGTDNDH